MITGDLGRRTLKATSLATLRLIAERFAGGRLPEWDNVAATAILSVHDARERMDVAGFLGVQLRGQSKLITWGDDGRETVEQFLSRGDLAAARVRPEWASTAAPPLSISRWYGREWSIPDMEWHSLSPCTILHIDTVLVAALAEKYPTWSRVHSAFLWTYIDIMWVIVQDARVKSAAQRYRELMSRPSPPTAAKQGELASFLSITRPALNRILSPSQARVPEPDDQDATDDAMEADKRPAS